MSKGLLIIDRHARTSIEDLGYAVCLERHRCSFAIWMPMLNCQAIGMNSAIRVAPQ